MHVYNERADKRFIPPICCTFHARDKVGRRRHCNAAAMCSNWDASIRELTIIINSADITFCHRKYLPISQLNLYDKVKNAYIFIHAGIFETIPSRRVLF